MSKASVHLRIRPLNCARGALALASIGGLMLLHQNRAAARDPLDEDVPGAREAIAAAATGDGDDPEAPAEFEFSLEMASAYVFRGYNVFQERDQREQNMVQRPRFIWTPARTGFSAGYSAANQLTGPNLAHNVAAGLGAEQDLFAIYELRRRSALGAFMEMSVVAYPFANKDVAGTSVPLFVSAATELRYERSLFVYLGYLRGLRHGPIGDDYFYLNPRMDKRWEIGRRFELEVDLGVGLKVFTDSGPLVRDNGLDVLASATLYYALNDVLYLGAKVGWAWTNLKAFRDPASGETVTPGLADEYIPFWSLSIGSELNRGFAAVKRAPSGHRLHPL